MLLTTKEVCAELNISKYILDKYKDRINVVRMGRTDYFDKNEVELALKSPNSSGYEIRYYEGKAFCLLYDIVKKCDIKYQTLRNKIYRKGSRIEKNVDYCIIPSEKAVELNLIKEKVPNGIMAIYYSGFVKLVGTTENSIRVGKLLFGENFSDCECESINSDKRHGQYSIFDYDFKKNSLNQSEQNNAIVDSMIKECDAYKAMIKQQGEQINSLIELVKSVIADRISGTPESEVSIDDIVEDKTVNTTENWYARINDLVTDISNVSNLNKNAVLSQAYKILNSQYGICTEQYKKEYQQIIGKKPNTLSTIFWIENEKNPNTNGLLEGVLETMLKENVEKSENKFAGK